MCSIFGLSWFIFSGKVETQLKLKKKKKICAECGEGAATDQMCQSGLRSFVLEISGRMMLHGVVDQLKLVVIKWRHWEQAVLYYAGDSRHIQSTHISKVAGENEKWVFYIMERSK